jgi:hypothetical protein
VAKRNLPNGARLYLDKRSPTSPLLIVGFFAYKIVPSLIAGMSIYLGYRLFVLGVSGQASLVVNSTTISGQLLNAAPGLFFAIGGIAALLAVVLKGAAIQSPDGSADGERLDFRGLV